MCVALRSSLEGTSLSGGVCTAGEESAKPNVMVHVRAGQWHMAYTVSYLCSGAGVHRGEAVVRWREAEKCSGSCDGSIATRVVPYRRVGGSFITVLGTLVDWCGECQFSGGFPATVTALVVSMCRGSTQ